MEEIKRRKPLCDAPGYIAVSRKDISVDDLILPLDETRYIIFEITADEIAALDDLHLGYDLRKETRGFYDISELEDCAIEAKDVPVLKRIAERFLSESKDDIERSALEKVIKAAEEAERIGIGAPIVFLF